MQHAYRHHIRAMERRDLEAVLIVQAACYPPSMREAEPVVSARMETAAGTCMVAEDAQGVCAYLFAYPGRLGSVTPLGADFLPAGDADTLYLHDLSVAPRAHGRGLARSLVGHVLSLAQQQGLASSALVSVQDTAGFWTAFGFREFQADDAAARAALASYPGVARYMVKTFTEPGAPSPNC